MQESDLETVAAIEEASFTDPWPIQSFRGELHLNQLATYLVARTAAGEVIAYIGAWLLLDEVHITTLAVTAPYRRLGIASRLATTLVERTRALGASCITLEVRPSNIAARSFYEKLGLAVCGRRKRYYYDEDALIMTRYGLELEHPAVEGDCDD